MAVPEDIMGYDRAITVFSPDGRLLQVEYAKKTVQQGATVIGMVCKDGAILVADKRIYEKLLKLSSVKKIYKIDDHIAAALSGLISDGKLLIEVARDESQRYTLLYDEPVNVEYLVNRICEIKQYYTQYGGVRPFGVSLLIIAVNDEPRLFVTEPSGIYYEYYATSIGEGSEEVNKILEEKYDRNITMEEGIRLAIKALKKVLKNNFNIEKIEVAMIPLKTKKFVKLSKEEIKRIAKE